ncbi:MAG: putative acyl-CoA dehydrogenase [Marmoricola sp.]|nr:putative acyl-CoA dehydrogenase [Marmoricola sp.]
MGTFDFDEDQEALRQTVRAFASEVFSEAEVRRLIASDSVLERSTWVRMAQEIGLQGLVVPEDLGGAGVGLVELAIVLEEFGRRLVPAPFLSTALATLALLDGDPTVVADSLRGIAEGSVVATPAFAEIDGGWQAGDVDCGAVESADGWRLNGVKSYVGDGMTADVFVVAARTSSGIGFFLVDADTPGVSREALEVFDPTRPLARLELDDVEGRPLARGGGDPAAVERFLDRARIAVAAEQAGGADFALGMAVEYAKDRVQFGRAIGSFQAVKHMCADAFVDVESARSAAYYGAWAVATGSEEIPTVAPLAKAFCSDTFLETAATTMQVHGGISFTYEYPAHLYFRRAKSGTQLWGSPRDQRDLLASRIGLDRAAAARTSEEQR